MKVPVKWLREYINIDLPLAEVARRLTMAGTETSLLSLGQSWQGVVVGQIVAVEPHPDADRLRLVTVDIAVEKQTVVCGAPNLELGDKIAFARIGAELIDGHSGQKMVLKPAKIRGVTSCGMVCSEKELGISDSHEGIMVLPPAASLGIPLVDFLGDTVLDLEVTPNRPDLLSVIGVAYEVAALAGQSVSLPEVDYESRGAPIDRQVSVEIAAPDLCPRYCASLITGVKIGESPEWLKQCLIGSGMRPINNIVDVTNYVMLEHGQPLHSFDYSKIKGGRIIVRRALDSEVMVSLDGVERRLTGDMLVIADTERAVAIAGVMGGANSEVNPETGSILLEAASFNPASIHYTSRRLGLVSEASMRFERAIRPELALLALKRATQLILQMAGGKAATGFIDVYPGRKEPAPILLRVDRANRLLGTDFKSEQIAGTLKALGCNLKPASSPSAFLVSAPYWRSDVRLEVDLVEEVARVIGYDKVPDDMLARQLPRQNPEPIIGLKKRVRQILTGFGFQEVITYSLTSRESLEKAFQHPSSPEPIHLANAMTAEQGYLRTSLRGNLLAALETNLRHEGGAIMLFELGKVYLRRAGDLPDEPEILCGLLSCYGAEKQWRGRNEPFDFFDAKGVMEGLLGQLRLEAGFEDSTDDGLQSGRQATITISSKKIGVVGGIHPAVIQTFDITGEVYLFELNLAALLPHTLGYKTFQPIPRFPAVVRDIALVAADAVSHRQVMDIIQGFPLASKVTLFDVYTGKQVPPGKKSLAYRISFQSTEHTLTDEEADEVLGQILNRLSSELGASLRA